MRLFLKLVAYLLHPVLIPFAGTASYFLITPKYSPVEQQNGNLLPVFILTVIIPLICFLILKNLGLVRSAFLHGIGERLWPLLITIGLLLMVVFRVIPNNYTPELYFYFVGLIAGATACLILLLFRKKCSLHLMGLGSLLMFLIGLSIHFEVNITLAISACTLAIGLAATSRLYLRAHRVTQLIIGLFIGVLSQLFTFKFWL